MYIYIYIYMCVCVCVLCMYIYRSYHKHVANINYYLNGCPV